jgi:hypothetical protein
MVFQMLLWWVLRKRLRLKAYKPSFVEDDRSSETINSLYAFKYKHFHNTFHTVTFWNTIAKLFFKHPAVLVEVTLNPSYPR